MKAIKSFFPKLYVGCVVGASDVMLNIPIQRVMTVDGIGQAVVSASGTKSWNL